MFIKYKLIRDEPRGIRGMAPLIATRDAACMDLFIPYDCTIGPKEHRTIDLLIAFDIPIDWCLYLQPRSSTFTNRGLLSTTGVIDSDYKGTVHAQLFNMTTEPVTLKRAERVVQCQLIQKFTLQLEEVDKIASATVRRSQIGSTGL